MAIINYIPNVKTATGFDTLNTVSQFTNHVATGVFTNGDTYEINVPAPNDILTGQFVLIFVPDSDSIVGMKISINNGAAIPIDGVGAGSLQDGVATSLLVDVASGVAYLNKKIYNATITTTWVGASAPYTQDVTVSGITSNDNPYIKPIYSSNNATAILEKAAWNMINEAATSANTITFTCFEDKPTQQVQIYLEVVR